MSNWPPTFGICGWSGSGKTTLIEALVREFRGRGLCIGVVKHQAHGLDVDREGKDTDRFFRAGAAVAAHDAQQGFTRFPVSDDNLDDLVARLGVGYDLVLVEGHKSADMPKIWLCRDDAPPPKDVTHIAATLAWDEDRLARALPIVDDYLAEFHRRMDVCVAILLGVQQPRPGESRALDAFVDGLPDDVHEAVMVTSDAAPELLKGLPVLPPASDVRWPLSGHLAAMRWRPATRWLFAAHAATAAQTQQLLSHAGPGRWAVLPRAETGGQRDWAFCVLDPPALPLLEAAARRGLRGLAGILPAERVAWQEKQA